MGQPAQGKGVACAVGIVLVLMAGGIALGVSEGCKRHPPVAASGARQAEARVNVDSNGLTTEQRNIKRRIEEDGKPGSTKFLYVISSTSGQVILYSTVDGKVTSSGKRLTPTHVEREANSDGFQVRLGGSDYTTDEVLQDDGTYGNSAEYIYWWDTAGIYHQHFLGGGTFVHISSRPLPVKNALINLETPVRN